MPELDLDDKRLRIEGQVSSRDPHEIDLFITTVYAVLWGALEWGWLALAAVLQWLQLWPTFGPAAAVALVAWALAALATGAWLGGLPMLMSARYLVTLASNFDPWTRATLERTPEGWLFDGHPAQVEITQTQLGIDGHWYYWRLPLSLAQQQLLAEVDAHEARDAGTAAEVPAQLRRHLQDHVE